MLAGPGEDVIARRFLDSIDSATTQAETASDGEKKGEKEVLTLTEEGTVVWREDAKYDEVLSLLEALPE